MDPLQKKLKNIKHCASPSLAQYYEEHKDKLPCMKINRQNHADCCGCKEPCCTVELPKLEQETQNEL